MQECKGQAAPIPLVECVRNYARRASKTRCVHGRVCSHAALTLVVLEVVSISLHTETRLDEFVQHHRHSEMRVRPPAFSRAKWAIAVSTVQLAQLETISIVGAGRGRRGREPKHHAVQLSCLSVCLSVCAHRDA